MKLSPTAVVALSVLSLVIIGKIAFIISDLYLVDEPIFYILQTCQGTDLRTGVLWSNVIANLTILIPACFIYRLFQRVVVQAVWKKNDSLRLAVLFSTASLGFFLIKLAELIANDFLLKPSEIGCPLFSSALTSSYYLKAATLNLLLDPLFLIVVLLMALISAFLKHSYGLKEENDSFI